MGFNSSYTETNASLGLFEILFSNFNGVDLTSIDSISLTIAGTVASDLQLDFQGYTGSQSIQTEASPVPVTPATWLFLTGFISLFASRKKLA